MSMSGGAAPKREPTKIDAVLNALSGSYMLELLGMSTDDLDQARTDSTLFETLRITHELLVVLRDEGVLGTFLLLPKDEQVKFVRRIGATDDEDLRRGRTGTFVDALRRSPLADSARYGDPTPL